MSDEREEDSINEDIAKIQSVIKTNIKRYQVSSDESDVDSECEVDEKDVRSIQQLKFEEKCFVVGCEVSTSPSFASSYQQHLLSGASHTWSSADTPGPGGSSYVPSTALSDVDDILEVDLLDRDVPVCPENCLALNAACQQVLQETLNKLLTALRMCINKQDRISKEIEDAKFNRTKQGPMHTRGTWYFMFGTPYFKDRQFYPCPPNEDVYIKQQRAELNVEASFIKQWRLTDQRRLKAAVRANAVELKTNELLTVKENIMLKLRTEKDLAKCDEHEEKLKRIDVQIKDIMSRSHELIQNRFAEYDWMKISSVTFEGIHSPEECRLMWMNYLHPSINKSKWTHEEDQKLRLLGCKHNEQDWDRISEELGTNRAPFQCYSRYQSCLNESMKKSKWTDEEDFFLSEVVKRCRIGSYIPWGKVSYYIEGRTKSQVYNRWCYSLDPCIRKGRFSKEEDYIIAAGVRRYGLDFPRIARFLPGRTSIQIRDRYAGSLKYVGPIGAWSRQEDKKLFSLVRKYGKSDWSTISSFLSGRTRTTCRHRYSTLVKWLQKNPGATLANAPTRYLGNQNDRIESLWREVRDYIRSSANSIRSSVVFHPPQADVSDSVPADDLVQLRKKFKLSARKKPGRKQGHKKKLSQIDTELNQYFRCAYSQMGRGKRCTGRKRVHYPYHEVKLWAEKTDSLTTYFGTDYYFPKNQHLIVDDVAFEESDISLALALRERAASKQRSNTVNNGHTEPQPSTSQEGSQSCILEGDTSKQTTVNGIVKYQGCPVERNLCYDSGTLQVLHHGVKKMVFCPPNHTTCVGFRGVLLSRKGLLASMNKVCDCEEDTSEDEINPYISPSKRLGAEDAEDLFWRRFASLFYYPSIMTNRFPQINEGLFTKDVGRVASSKRLSDDSCDDSEREQVRPIQGRSLVDTDDESGDAEQLDEDLNIDEHLKIVEQQKKGRRQTRTTSLVKKKAMRERWKRQKAQQLQNGEISEEPPRKKRKYVRSGQYAATALSEKKITRLSSRSATSAKTFNQESTGASDDDSFIRENTQELYLDIEDDMVSISS